MRIAVVADVHGNLPALEAVLAEIEADAIVCCGDVSGPFGEECRALLERAGAHFVRGNGDERVDWPLTLQLDVLCLGRVLFCHGSPRSEHEVLTRLSPEARVEAALDGVTADVVVHGHTHMQYDRRVVRHRLVNPGSVGMPYEGARGAFWAVLGPDVEFRRTDYAEQDAWLPKTFDPDETSALFEADAGA